MLKIIRIYYSFGNKQRFVKKRKYQWTKNSEAQFTLVLSFSTDIILLLWNEASQPNKENKDWWTYDLPQPDQTLKNRPIKLRSPTVISFVFYEIDCLPWNEALRSFHGKKILWTCHLLQFAQNLKTCSLKLRSPTDINFVLYSTELYSFGPEMKHVNDVTEINFVDLLQLDRN